MPVLPSVPPAAAAAGYKMLTFGPQMIVGAFPGDTGNWERFNFFGSDWTKQPITINSDGSVVMYANGANNYAAMLCSAHLSKGTTPLPFGGVAFGGGAYFEAIMSFILDTITGGPAFWTWPIEALTQSGSATTHWPGQAADYGDFVEIDFAEFYPGIASEQINTSLLNWYGNTGQSLGEGNIPRVSGIDWNQPHKYGFLWTPATATTQGSGKWFLDDQPIGITVTWNLYDPTLPPPPVYPGSAFSVLDKTHLALILGNFQNVTNPVTVHGVSVWQASAANNLVV